MSGMRSFGRRLRDDSSGFTLIELVVASALTVVIAVVIGKILITTLGSEQTVRTTTQATSSGQLVAQSIDKGVRNASWINPAAIQGNGEYFLTVRTANDEDIVEYNCQAWYITASGSAYVRTAKTIITKPAGGNVTGWTLLATGLEPYGTLPMLDRSGAEIIINFEVDAGDAPNALITTSALSRQTSTGGAECEH